MNPLVPIRRLVARVRHPITRAEALVTLGERLRRAIADQPFTEREQSIAARLRELREKLSDLGNVSACGTCCVGKPLPQGRWDGGHCCSGDTADVFSDDEVFALAAAGTRPRDLVAPRGDHAGCAFRGALGCSLEPRHRPNVCVRYLCRELRAELHRGSVLMEVVAGIDELEALFAELAALHAARLERAELRAIHPMLGDPSES